MADPDSRVRYFPISFFSVVMGLMGLTLVLQRGVRIWGLPSLFGEMALYLSTLVFLALSVLYAMKIFRFGVEVIAEFRDPVKLSFFPAYTISLILLSVGYLGVSLPVARFFWLVGSIGQLTLTLMVLSAWINRTTFEIQHMNPAWFIPVLGNLLVPIAGVPLGSSEPSWFFFSVGMVFWVVLLTIIFNRVIFHHPLAESMVPTFFILIAPPAVGQIAYSELVGGIDPFGRILYYVALFTGLMLATQWKTFLRLKFFLSWWAYSFPLAALTLSTISMLQLTGTELFSVLSALLAVVLSATIAMLIWFTLRAAGRREIGNPDA
jgi:tellurite resistance protein